MEGIRAYGSGVQYTGQESVRFGSAAPGRPSMAHMAAPLSQGYVGGPQARLATPSAPYIASPATT